MAKECIKLRKKPLLYGGFSLFLDIHYNGRRYYEFLKLYLNPGDDPLTKAKNRNTLEAAKMIQAKRLIEIQSNAAGIILDSRRSITFMDFCKELIADKPLASDSYKGHIMTIAEYMERFSPKIKVSAITPAVLREFANFLQETESLRSKKKIEGQFKTYHGACRQPTPEEIREEVLKLTGEGVAQRKIAELLGISRTTVETIQRKAKQKATVTKLSPRSVQHYFTTLNTVLRKAVKKGIIPNNPVNALDSGTVIVNVKESIRQYLTADELKKLKDTPIANEMTKRMFLFSCFTGLRYSDARKVTWNDIDAGKIEMVMEKTKHAVYVPLSQNALNCLPPRRRAKHTDPVFTDLPSLDMMNRYLRKWVEAAGINKHISFHCSRHTFATMLLSFGTDLYTVSKLLGHKDIKATQIYARIIDKKKEEAVNSIPTL